jgi:hypothetical protein
VQQDEALAADLGHVRVRQQGQAGGAAKSWPTRKSRLPAIQ